jgi:hypothetical protein
VLFIYGRELSTAKEKRLLDTTTGAGVALEEHAAPRWTPSMPQP